MVTKLWDSWEDDAVVADRASGRLRRHRQGPPDRPRRQALPGRRPAQRAALAAGPAGLVQAGSSEDGRLRRPPRRGDLHRAADARRTPRSSTPTSRPGPRRLGRDPDQLKVLPGISPFIGSTEAEARALEEELDELIQPRVRPDAARQRSRRRPGRVRPRRARSRPTCSRRGRTDGAPQPRRSSSLDIVARENARPSASCCAGSPVRAATASFTGTPEQVADAIEEWFEQRRRRRLQRHAAVAARAGSRTSSTRWCRSCRRAACSARSTPAPRCASTTGWPAPQASTPRDPGEPHELRALPHRSAAPASRSAR